MQKNLQKPNCKLICKNCSQQCKSLYISWYTIQCRTSAISSCFSSRVQRIIIARILCIGGYGAASLEESCLIVYPNISQNHADNAIWLSWLTRQVQCITEQIRRNSTVGNTHYTTLVSTTLNIKYDSQVKQVKLQILPSGYLVQNSAPVNNAKARQALYWHMKESLIHLRNKYIMKKMPLDIICSSIQGL